MASIADGIFTSSSYTARFCSSVASAVQVNSTTCLIIALLAGIKPRQGHVGEGFRAWCPGPCADAIRPGEHVVQPERLVWSPAQQDGRRARRRNRRSGGGDVSGDAEVDAIPVAPC